MPGHREWDPECKVFIGGLRDDANRYDIEDVFRKYGPVKDVWVARKPPGFAFVEMEDPRDARDASRSLDGTRICGARSPGSGAAGWKVVSGQSEPGDMQDQKLECRVEMSDPGKRRGRGGDGRGDRGGRSRSRSRGRGSRRSPSYTRRRSPSYERGRGGRSRSPRDKKRDSSYDRRRSRSPRDDRDSGRPVKREDSRDSGRPVKREDSRDRADSRDREDSRGRDDGGSRSRSRS